MRIPYDVMRDGLSAINQAANEMAAAQRQVSTGRRINAVGDDPLGAERAVTENAGIGTIDAYSRTVNAASAKLASADATLSSFGDKLGAAIVAGLSARGSSTTPASRAASAADVLMLRDSLLADINTSFDGVAVFAGTQSNAVAYAQVGSAWVYQGNSDTMKVEVERSRLVPVTFDGQEIAQGSDPKNVFTVLDDLVTAINAGNDTDIGIAIAGLERAFDRTARAQGRLGAGERGLDDATLRLASLRQAANVRRSKLEDANMADAVTQLTDAQKSYNAALASVSVVERTSLLDYLR